MTTTTTTPKYFARVIGTDSQPCSVLEIKTERKIIIRDMVTKALPWNMKAYIGGFSANIANQEEQKWEIREPLETEAEYTWTTTIRLNKRGEWKDANGNRYIVTQAPKKFYDYNF